MWIVAFVVMFWSVSASAAPRKVAIAIEGTETSALRASIEGALPEGWIADDEPRAFRAALESSGVRPFDPDLASSDRATLVERARQACTATGASAAIFAHGGKKGAVSFLIVDPAREGPRRALRTTRSDTAALQSFLTALPAAPAPAPAATPAAPAAPALSPSTPDRDHLPARPPPARTASSSRSTPYDEALALAGERRIRPIAMTTLAGVAPLALGIDSGAELQRSLALAVIGGLGLSSMLSTLALPSIANALHRSPCGITPMTRQCGSERDPCILQRPWFVHANRNFRTGSTRPSHCEMIRLLGRQGEVCSRPIANKKVAELEVLMNRRFFGASRIVGCLALLAAVACGGTDPTDQGFETDIHRPTASSSGLAAVKSVFVIVLENHNWASIKGSASAPYINGTLLTKGAHAEQYFNPPGLHPSEPNYIWLEAGDNLGIKTDVDPSANHSIPVGTDHLSAQLERAGKTWRSYQEDMTPGTCPTKSSGLYAAKHNPMVFFQDVSGSPPSPTNAGCMKSIRPSSELAGDLSAGRVGDYNFITPNLCNDSHGHLGCPSDLIKASDDWLSRVVPIIQASAKYRDNGAIFITYDESEHGDHPIGMIVLSPLVTAGHTNNVHYTHSSMLASAEEIFGLPKLRDAANATTLADLFASTVTTAP